MTDDIDRVLDRIEEEISTLGLDYMVVAGIDIAYEYDKLPIFEMGKAYPVAVAHTTPRLVVSKENWDQIFNDLVPHGTQHPANPVVGATYWNLTEGQLYLYADQAGWLPISGPKLE